MIKYQTNTQNVDWEALKADLIADDFHNGRTTEQLRLSFENSQVVALGFDAERCIANGRLLSDGVGNAYMVDIWTHSDYNGRGIGSTIVQMLLDAVPGQHVYMQVDKETTPFYERLGFGFQPLGMSTVVGEYLNNNK